MAGKFGNMTNLGTPASSLDALVTSDESTPEKTSQLQFSGKGNESLSGTAGWIPVQNTVDSVSALLSVDQEGHAATTGFYSAGDGGVMLFYWDSTKVKTDHNGGTIIDPDTTVTPGAAGWWTTTSTSGTGCWVAVEVDEVNIIVFGAIANDSAYDSVFAINNAITAVSIGPYSRLYIPAGIFYVFDKITIKSNVVLCGGVKSSVIRATFPLLHSDDYKNVINSSTTVIQENIEFKDFFLDLTHPNTASGFMLGGINNLTFDGVHITGQDSPTIVYGMIAVSLTDWGTNTLRSTNVVVKNCILDKTNIFGVVFSNVRGGLITENIITNSHREAIGLEPWESDPVGSLDPAEVTNVIVSNNTITVSENSYFSGGSPDPAMAAGGALSEGYVNNCLFIGNTVIGQDIVAGSTYRGMTVIGGQTLYAENISVIGNTFINMNGPAVTVSVGGFKTKGIQIIGNIFLECNQGQVSDIGIVQLRDAFNTTVAKNIFKGTLYDYQVKESLGGADNIIVGNKGNPGQIKNILEFTVGLITDDFVSTGGGKNIIDGLGTTMVETVTIVDGATHTFAANGIINRCMFTLVSSYGPEAGTIFYGASSFLPTTVYVGTQVTFGATEPSIAGNVNIWPSVDGTQINVKNLLGSDRTFMLKSIGTE